MKIRHTVCAVALSLGLGLGVAIVTPVSAHTLAQGKPYGCQISAQACATPAVVQSGPPPSALPQTGGGLHNAGMPGNVALPVAGLALALAGFGIRRATRR